MRAGLTVARRSDNPAQVGRFDQKTALVSGASSGIGLAVAERLGAEGANLVLVAAPKDADDLERSVAMLRQQGYPVEGLGADIALEETAGRAVELSLSRFGGLDVLINNAGVAYYENVLDTPIEHLDRTLAVNVRGTFAMSLAAARTMAEQRRGAIVNTASTASSVGEEYQVTYNTSKGAIAALTRSLAVDLAPWGIRVNAVAPGWVATRATMPVIEDPEQWSKHRSRIPFDRPADPKEIAAIHAFLASDDASYVTGAIYFVDGGLTAGYRYSNWAAVENPPPGIGIPAVPADMHGVG
jgi:NAD(P)-dependent dehydrogenase (short-subunit alcohol dehydrogenase family)